MTLLLKCMYAFVAAGFLLRWLYSFIAPFSRARQWDVPMSATRHDGTPIPSEMVFFATPVASSLPVVSAESTLQERKENVLMWLCGLIVPILFGLGWGSLGVWLFSIAIRWQQALWCLAIFLSMRRALNRRPVFLSIVGTDATTFYFGQADYRGGRASVERHKTEPLGLIRQMYIRKEDILLFFDCGQKNVEQLCEIRRPVMLNADEWLRLKIGIHSRFLERQWSLILLRLAFIEKLSVEGIDVRDLIGIRFDVLGPAGTNQNLSVLVQSAGDDLVQRLVTAQLAFTLRSLVVDCRKDSRVSTDLQQIHRISADSATCESTNTVTWPTDPGGALDADSSPALRLQLTATLCLTIQPQQLPNLGLLKRLVNSGVWKHGIAYVIRKELESDQAVMTAVVANTKPEGSPFGVHLARHRVAIWKAAELLMDCGQLADLSRDEVQHHAAWREPIDWKASDVDKQLRRAAELDVTVDMRKLFEATTASYLNIERNGPTTYPFAL